MKRFVLTFIAVLLATQSNAAILCERESGGIPGTVPTLAAGLASATCKSVVVTSALSAVQSNISSATVPGGVWKTDYALRVDKGGSINPTTAFTGWRGATPEAFGFSTTATGAVNQTALTRFSAAIVSGDSVKMPTGTFAVTGLWTIATPCKIDMAGCVLNFATDAPNQGVRVTSSDVEITRGEVNGPQYATSVPTQQGIYASGADSAHYISGLKVIDTKFNSWSASAIETQFVEHFILTGNVVTNGYGSGILFRSSNYGKVTYNDVKDIWADSVLGSTAYSISITKSSNIEATYPVSHHIDISHNSIDGCIHEALGTHGGHHLTFDSNRIINSKVGINANIYDGKAPTSVVISNNNIDRGTLDVSGYTSSSPAIIVMGDVANTVRGTGNVITGNTIVGMGSVDSTLVLGAAVQTIYQDGVTVTGNNIYNSGRVGILHASSININQSGNVIKTISGTVPAKATGTITFAGQPTAADTITINGAVFTYRATVTATNEIAIGADLTGTLVNTATVLNAATDTSTTLPIDGRVPLATYTSDATKLTISYDYPGRNGNYFTLAASVATASGSGYLSGGAVGSSAVHFNAVSAGGASSGIMTGDVIDVGATYAAYSTIAAGEDVSVRIVSPSIVSAGCNFDLKGSAAAYEGNGGAAYISPFGTSSITINLPSIASLATYKLYLPLDGARVLLGGYVSMTRTAEFLGYQIRGGVNYLVVLITNPTSAAIDVASQTIYVKADYLRGL